MYRILFVLCFNSIYLTKIEAQFTLDRDVWCPYGATWIYKSFSKWSNLYYKFSYEKDTIILNKVVKQINVDSIEFYDNDLVISKGRAGKEYLYNFKDTVYYYDFIDNKFILLYIFNSKSNDTIDLRNNRAFCYNGGWLNKNDKIVMNSKTIDTFSNRIFEVLNYNQIGNLSYGQVVKNIGSTVSFLPNFNQLNCSLQKAEYGLIYEGLVCYFDSIRGYINVKHTLNNCNLFDKQSAINYLEKNSFSINPNPFSDYIIISGKVKKITIYNLYGIIVYSKIVNFNENIKLNFLLDGYYFVEIVDYQDNKQIVKLIKKSNL